MSFSSDRREFLKKRIGRNGNSPFRRDLSAESAGKPCAQAFRTLVVVNGSDPAADHTCSSRCFGRNGKVRKTRE